MYVITGASGNTGKEIAKSLLEAGKEVVVIGRNTKSLEELVEKGAKSAIGDLENVDFLTQTFKGATAVYALIPPKWDLTEDWRTYQRRINTSITKSIHQSGVQNVVVLSSNGAHLPEGAGPVTGLYEFEKNLKEIHNLNILSLRPGYFMENLFGTLDMIKHLGFFGYSLKNDLKMPFVHTKDIAAVAVKHLLALDFKGFTTVFVSGSKDLSMDEVATIIGKNIGKPDLKYVTFSYEDAKNGMVQNGIPLTIAEGYNELFKSLNDGLYLNDYQRNAENTTPTTLEWFVENQLKYVYQQN
ncbi:MAG: NAD-dependent epimerase/dehydratase family protein [Cytophagia bacterium]|nr:MAG: NAD-dependent epimerase/dehydratase family protein [Cytophagia bacterium]TAG43013.1 MAG: NAD-dependent epimerase/dehydratase family protein [Cytophagia bacterium]